MAVRFSFGVHTRVKVEISDVPAISDGSIVRDQVLAVLSSGSSRLELVLHPLAAEGLRASLEQVTNEYSSFSPPVLRRARDVRQLPVRREDRAIERAGMPALSPERVPDDAECRIARGDGRRGALAAGSTQSMVRRLE